MNFGNGEKLIVIDLDDEGDLVGVLAGEKPQHPDGGGDGVAAAFDGELDDVLGIEIHRVRRERCARRVLDALVDRQDRKVSAPRQTAVIVQPA